jgi:hypothetical protein
VKGQGVQETFRLVTRLLLKDIAQKHRVDISPPKDESITVKIPDKEQFGAVETVMHGAPPAVEAVAPRRAFKETEQVSSRTRPASVGAPSYDEGLASLTSSLNEVTQSLSGIKETLSVLYRETKESGRQHTETMRMLREISSAMAQARRKRRWFHFFS